MANAINDGGPAFPVVVSNTGDPEYPGQHQVGNHEWQMYGLTLRDYFAAKAMQGMLTDLPKTCYGTDWKANVAYEAYALANSMMRARKE